MANLIPPKGRTIVVREYWMRVATVWMFLIAVACLVIAALMAPTYVLIDSQQAAHANRFDDARSKQDAFDAAKAEIEQANKLARYLDRTGPPASASSLVRTVDELAGPGITLTQYNFAQDNGSVTPFSISGVATNRTALADFRDALGADARFATVDLPLAHLAGGEDLTFSMELTLADE